MTILAKSRCNAIQYNTIQYNTILNLDPSWLLALPFLIPLVFQLWLVHLSYRLIFLRPYHFLRSVFFLGANGAKSAPVDPQPPRGDIKIFECNAMQCNTIQYNTIQYNTIQYNTIQYNTIQYNIIHCNTIHCNAIQCNKKSKTILESYNVTL